MSKPSLDSKSKPSCECQKDCVCSGCPKVNFSSSSHVCNHGTKPTCACDEQPKKKTGVCKICIEDEPVPKPDPERTASIMRVLKYDRSCNCKVVTRAVRADVHRYLGMIDRHQHKRNEDLALIDNTDLC